MPRSTSLRLHRMPSAFDYQEHHYKKATAPSIVLSPPTPTSDLNISPAPSFCSVDIGDLNDRIDLQGYDRSLEASSSSSHETIHAANPVTSFLSVVYEKAAAQYRSYGLMNQWLESDHVGESSQEGLLPLHHIPSTPESQSLSIQNDPLEPSSASPSIEQRLAERIGPDVRDVVGSTVYSVATGSDSQRERYVPFAGVERNGMARILQGMYTAFRTEVTNILAE